MDKAVEAVKEEYRLAMMDPGDAAEERRRAKGYDEVMLESVRRDDGGGDDGGAETVGVRKALGRGEE